ncbi:MAG: DUF1295 domain-containing protein [Bacteroidia bacterium]
MDIFFWGIVGWMGVAVITFIILQFTAAPYGRHVRAGWGPTLPNRLGWLFMELPGLILVPTLFFLGSGPKTTVHYVLVGCYVAHYVHRSLIFPWRTKTTGKRMPIAIMGSAIFFNLMNGSVLGGWLGNYATYPENWITSPAFLIGAAVFLIGVAINVDADNRLLSLRKPGETGYKIPQGGLFRFISCPNLFGEVVEWIGFAIMGWNIATLSFAVWTAANLLPRAIDHHRWYLKQFPEYPRERRAVIPGLW